jgi:hypothetical protein
LLQQITIDDLRFSPDPGPRVEVERLRLLQAAFSLPGHFLCDLTDLFDNFCFSCLILPQISTLSKLSRRFRTCSVRQRVPSTCDPATLASVSAQLTCKFTWSVTGSVRLA